MESELPFKDFFVWWLYIYYIKHVWSMDFLLKNFFLLLRISACQRRELTLG
jgi:hypothetical protein